MKIAVALASGVPDVRDDIEKALRRVNLTAADEGRDAVAEVVGWCEEAAYPWFYRESPRPLIEKIGAEFSPDVIIGVFMGRMGVARQDDPLPPEEEFKLLSRTFARPHPRVRLYFLDKTFNAQTADEKEQKNFFLKFRSDFATESQRLFRYVKQSKLSEDVYDYVWELIRQSTRPNIPPPKLDLPEGWRFINSEFLDEKRGKLSDEGKLAPEIAASYFNGESPKWEYIVSKSVLPREAVGRLEKEIGEKSRNGRPRVTLLIGPGGEGKSTILQQLAAGLAEHYPNVHVIWRKTRLGKVAPLDESLFEKLLKEEGDFVIIADNAEQIAEEVWRGVNFLLEQPRSNIQFLLAVRTIDWVWAGADRWGWRRLLGEGDFLAERVNSLSKEDARRVVAAWEDAGPAGLGQFAGIEEGKRAQHLFKLAEEKRLRDREEKEGSLLGAMLDARKSATFRDYVKGILNRLEARAAPGDRTLRNVFAYIVALHADNQQILSRKVLGRVLSCPDKLEAEVITPLADEAAADASGWIILARHRTIAEVAREILARDFHVNFERQIIPDLLQAAAELYIEGELDGDEIKPWNHLPTFYARQRQIELAIRLVKIRAELSTDDPFWVVNWANILRKGGRRYQQEAAKLFGRRYHLISREKLNKGFFVEWAVAERVLENNCLAVWLLGVALSDNVREKYEGDTPYVMLFSGLTPPLSKLHDKASDPRNTAFFNPSNAQTFAEACAATAQLGHDARSQKGMRPDFDIERAKGNLEVGRRLAHDKNIHDVEAHEALTRLLGGIKLAWELRANERDKLPDSVPKIGDLAFGKIYAMFKGTER